MEDRGGAGTAGYLWIDGSDWCDSSSVAWAVERIPGVSRVRPAVLLKKRLQGRSGAVRSTKAVVESQGDLENRNVQRSAISRGCDHCNECNRACCKSIPARSTTASASTNKNYQNGRIGCCGGQNVLCFL